MLNEKRIKKAENNVRKYLEDQLIYKHNQFRKEILDTYRRNYRESLNVAKTIFDQKLSSLWVVVCSYYAMYYVANAVLYKMGYKVGSKISHKVTADSLVVFIRNKLKKEFLEEYEEAKEEVMSIIGKRTDEVISSFELELNKRSFFQYETTEEIKNSKANTSLERAKKFVFEMEKLF